MCDQETSKTRRLKPATGLWKYNHNGLYCQENKQPSYLYIEQQLTEVQFLHQEHWGRTDRQAQPLKQYSE
jgi:hypothetical protein